MISVTHFFTHFQSLGGVQSLLRRHLELDARWGLETDVVAFFDAVQTADQRVRVLELSWKSTVLSSRNKFSACLQQRRNRFAVYHNLWGVPFFADLDEAQRRVGVLHVYPRSLGDCLSGNAGLVDGVLCVSQPLKDLVHQYLPELDESRVEILPLPISRCPVVPNRAPLELRPIVVGFNGRLVKEQKRIDRLPTLARVLDHAGLDYRLEVLGDGPDQAWLERQLTGNSKVFFHGRQAGESYWRILAGWDAIVFTSDFEGLPLSLLEAMSAGVLPVYPRINSGGDGYVKNVQAGFLYDLDELRSAARIVTQIAAAKDVQIELWRARCRQLVEPHTGDSYDKVYSSFVRRIADAPRISRSEFPPRPWYFSDCWPFAILARFYLRGFYRPAPS